MSLSLRPASSSPASVFFYKAKSAYEMLKPRVKAGAAGDLDLDHIFSKPALGVALDRIFHRFCTMTNQFKEIASNTNTLLRCTFTSGMYHLNIFSLNLIIPYFQGTFLDLLEPCIGDHRQSQQVWLE